MRGTIQAGVKRGSGALNARGQQRACVRTAGRDRCEPSISTRDVRPDRFSANGEATFTNPPPTGELILPCSHVCGSDGLLTNAQFSDDIEVSLRLFTPHIVKQTSATAHKTQQASSRSIILTVCPHMLSQPVNPLRQDGYLHLWGAGIGG